jgi:threonine dehydratase
VLYNILDKQKKEYWCVSAGNHAQGVAYYSKIFNYKAIIIMPINVNKEKLEILKTYNNVNIILQGNNFEEALKYGFLHFSKENYIPAYDSFNTINGQSTIIDEISQQNTLLFDYIFTPVGGGGLMAGLIKGIKRFNFPTKVIGIEHNRNNSMTISILNNNITHIDIEDKLCDGTTINQPGQITFPICKNNKMINVSKKEILFEIKQFYTNMNELIEPSSALSIAGLSRFRKNNDLKGKNIVLLITGKHISKNLANIITANSYENNFAYSNELFDNHIIT